MTARHDATTLSVSAALDVVRGWARIVDADSAEGEEWLAAAISLDNLGGTLALEMAAALVWAACEWAIECSDPRWEGNPQRPDPWCPRCAALAHYAAEVAAEQQPPAQAR